MTPENDADSRDEYEKLADGLWAMIQRPSPPLSHAEILAWLRKEVVCEIVDFKVNQKNAFIPPDQIPSHRTIEQRYADTVIIGDGAIGDGASFYAISHPEPQHSDWADYRLKIIKAAVEKLTGIKEL
jgi:hypothetical protein